MSTNDGGPFHPCEVTWRADGSVDGIQTQNHAGIHTGASLRDHFAGLAMMGSCACPDNNAPPSVVARWAYEMADAMIRAREAGQ